MNWLNIILSDVVTTLNIYIVLKNLSGININNKKTIMYIFLTFIMYLINFTFFSGVFKTVFSLFTIFIVSYMFLFEKNLNKSIYYSFCHILICLMCEILITLFLTIFSNYSIETYNNKNFSLLFFSILIFILSILVTSINKIKLKIRDTEKYLVISDDDRFYIFTLIILLFLLGFNNSVSFGKNITYYINFIIIVISFIIILLFVFNKVHMNKIKIKYNEMMEYVVKYEQIINEQGKRNHEYNNQLMVLSGYVNNPTKMKEYLSTIINEHKGRQNYKIKQLGYFPDGGIKGLIYHKLSRMEEYNIKSYLYVDKEVKNIFENDFSVKMYSDITKLFGVYIDNAIESAKDAETKEVEIDMKIDKDYLIITIGNTYPNNTDINKIGKKGFSTKGKGHGFGLSLVKDISKTNDKIETLTDINNNMFKQIIMIDLK